MANFFKLRLDSLLLLRTFQKTVSPSHWTKPCPFSSSFAFQSIVSQIPHGSQLHRHRFTSLSSHSSCFPPLPQLRYSSSSHSFLSMQHYPIEFPLQNFIFAACLCFGSDFMNCVDLFFRDWLGSSCQLSF